MPLRLFRQINKSRELVKTPLINNVAATSNTMLEDLLSMFQGRTYMQNNKGLVLATVHSSRLQKITWVITTLEGNVKSLGSYQMMMEYVQK